MRIARPTHAPRPAREVSGPTSPSFACLFDICHSPFDFGRRLTIPRADLPRRQHAALEPADEPGDRQRGIQEDSDSAQPPITTAARARAATAIMRLTRPADLGNPMDQRRGMSMAVGSRGRGSARPLVTAAKPPPPEYHG